MCTFVAIKNTKIKSLCKPLEIEFKKNFFLCKLLRAVTEIGNHIQISFYANNFFNNMAKVHSSQTNLSTSLFGSGYIPSFYYGLALRLRI